MACTGMNHSVSTVPKTACCLPAGNTGNMLPEEHWLLFRSTFREVKGKMNRAVARPLTSRNSRRPRLLRDGKQTQNKSLTRRYTHYTAGTVPLRLRYRKEIPPPVPPRGKRALESRRVSCRAFCVLVMSRFRPVCLMSCLVLMGSSPAYFASRNVSINSRPVLSLSASVKISSRSV